MKRALIAHVAALTIAGLAVSGCAGRQRSAEGRARVALEVSAQVVEDASNLTAGQYTIKADKCYQEATDRAGYDECMRAADAAALAIIEAAQAVRIAEHSLDIAAGASVLSCVLEALVDVSAAIDAAGWTIPVDVASAANMVRPFTGAPCSEVY